jgi:hypothetical protein
VQLDAPPPDDLGGVDLGEPPFLDATRMHFFRFLRMLLDRKIVFQGIVESFSVMLNRLVVRQ